MEDKEPVDSNTEENANQNTSSETHDEKKLNDNTVDSSETITLEEPNSNHDSNKESLTENPEQNEVEDDSEVESPGITKKLLEIDFFKENENDETVEESEIIEEQTVNGELEETPDDFELEEVQMEILEEMELEQIPRIIPSFWLLKGSEELELTDYFQPTDLLSLVINQTSSNLFTHVKMIDNRDQVRYLAKSAGSYHKFTTRLQNTRTFGDWKLVVEAPLLDTDEIETFEIPFTLIEHLHDDEEPLYVSLLEADHGYVLVFLDDEEQLLEILEEEVDEIDVEEEVDEISEEEISLSTEIETIDKTKTETVDEKPIEVVLNDKSDEEEVSEVEHTGYTNSNLPELEISVKEIHGIGPAFKKKLANIEIYFVHQMLDYTVEELADKSGIKLNKCQNWIAEARDIADNPNNATFVEFNKSKQLIEQILPDEGADSIEIANPELSSLNIPVSEIKGIGPSYQKKLAEHNLTFVHHLVQFTPDSLATLLSMNEKTVTKWMIQVVDIANNPSNEVYKEYLKDVIEEEEEELVLKEAIVGEVDFKNTNLVELNIPITEISGIGPSYFKKFEAIGIKYVHHILPYSPEKLCEKSGLSLGRCEKWCEQVNDIANNPSNEIFKKFNN